MQVTYIAITPEDLERTISKAVERGIEAYKKDLLDMDIRSINEWASYLRLDPRTIRKRIEDNKIVPISRRPYRLSMRQIKQIGGGAFS